MTVAEVEVEEGQEAPHAPDAATPLAQAAASASGRRAMLKTLAGGAVGMAAMACNPLSGEGDSGALNGEFELPEIGATPPNAAPSNPTPPNGSPSSGGSGGGAPSTPVAGGSDSSLPAASPGGEVAVPGAWGGSEGADAQPSPSTPDQPFASPTSGGAISSAVHLANRITFGLTPTLRREIEAMGPNAYLEDQLSKTGPDPKVESQLGAFRYLKSDDPHFPTDASRGRVEDELTYSNVVRSTFSEHQLYEMMVHLWMDHFNVSDLMRVYLMSMFDYQENVIRRHAMGKYRDLLVASAHAPAMMVYLNNFQSDAFNGRVQVVTATL